MEKRSECSPTLLENVLMEVFLYFAYPRPGRWWNFVFLFISWQIEGRDNKDKEPKNRKLRLILYHNNAFQHIANVSLMISIVGPNHPTRVYQRRKNAMDIWTVEVARMSKAAPECLVDWISSDAPMVKGNCKPNNQAFWAFLIFRSTGVLRPLWSATIKTTAATTQMSKVATSQFAMVFSSDVQTLFAYQERSDAMDIRIVATEATKSIAQPLHVQTTSFFAPKVWRIPAILGRL